MRDEQIWFGGGLMTLKVSSEQTGGAFALIEDVMPKGKTTPLHLHPTFDEAIYVLSGEILVHLGGTEFTVSAGEVAFAPRGSAHAFLVTSDEAHIIGFSTPGDVFESFIRQGGDVVTDPGAPTPPLDIAKVKAAGEATGAMQVLGPPPFTNDSSARSAREAEQAGAAGAAR